MAKIGALILPGRRRSELAVLSKKVASMLSLSTAQCVEKQLYYGATAVCSLIRVLPDPINTLPQPTSWEGRSGVMCGYYIPGAGTRGSEKNEEGIVKQDSATRLLEDVIGRGLHSLTRSDGVYAFTHWDPRDEVMIAGVDKLGMRPLFWISIKGGGYAVASEIKALVPFANEPLVNWSAWEEQLTFGFQLGNHTLINGINRLGPAEIITCSPYRMTVVQLERFSQNISIKPRSVSAFIEENHSTFTEAMDKCHRLLRPDQDHILTLSGGLDSRRILGWFCKKGCKCDSYTVPLVRRDRNGTENESGIVRALCRQYGITGYKVYPPRIEDRSLVCRVRDLAVDFESDEHIFATILTLALHRPNAVNFDGIGGGILINGAFLKSEYFSEGRWKLFKEELSQKVKHWFRLPQIDPPLEVRLSQYLNELGEDPNGFTLFYFLSRTRREIALAPMTIQANSFESFYPYLDRDVVQSALSFPPHEKVGAELQRCLIRALEPNLLEIPTSHDVSARSDARYTSFYEGWTLRKRARFLSEALRSISNGIGWGLPAAQRARLRVAAKLPWILTDDQLSSQLTKADFVMRFYHYMKLTASIEQYTKEARFLNGLFGSKSEWITRL